jgi:hypothetical protein
VYVVGCSAVSALGFERRGIARALRDGAAAAQPSVQLAISHPSTPAFEVGAVPAGLDPTDGRTRKLMSRSAHLAAVAVRAALEDAGWKDERQTIGLYLGVGASGGSMGELEAMLAASRDPETGAFSLSLFGESGLGACNPLFAFQLMNNFTLCHAAILAGVGGPNAALYSRGTGTVASLMEAMHGLGESEGDGDCDRALAGGADSALHPVTWAELQRDGFAAAGLVPAEGAAVLALARQAERPLALIESCTIRPGPWSLSTAVASLLEEPADAVVVVAWGEPPRAGIGGPLALGGKTVPLLDTSLVFGGCLAASPALAWVAALDLIDEGARRVIVLSACTDGDLGVVALRRPS